jgi:hypothetical protein
MEKQVLPSFDPLLNLNYHPHVLILGAGASLAAFPNGDRNGNLLPLMKNIASIISLEKELSHFGIKGTVSDFEKTYNDLYFKYAGDEILKKIEDKIFDYFSKLRLPDQLTLYDKLVLSLREKDLIATFNWDPFLALAIQRNRHLKRLPNIVFLHGNAFVGTCQEHNTIGFINCACSKCGRLFQKVDLLYPVQEKNYSDNDFIRNEWAVLKLYLEKAFMITIFGYSAPKTDLAAREVLLDVWKNNPIQNFAEIEIIDIDRKEKIEYNWHEFFVKNHYIIRKKIEHSYIGLYPRRSTEAFASSILQNDPWGDVKHYQGNSLLEYQHWIKEIIKSEDSNSIDKKTPLSRIDELDF